MKRLLLLCCLLVGLTSAGYSQTVKKAITNPEEKAKSLQKELKLTDSQTSKIAVVYKESSEKFDKLLKKVVNFCRRKDLNTFKGVK